MSNTPYGLEKVRLAGFPLPVQEMLMRVMSFRARWAELGDLQKAEALSLILLIATELNSRLANAWTPQGFVKAIATAQEFYNRVDSDSVIGDSLRNLQHDSQRNPVAYYYEFLRSRAQANLRKDTFRPKSIKERSYILYEKVVKNAREGSLQTLAAYEFALYHYGSSGNLLTLLEEAYEASRQIGRWSRAAEVALIHFDQHLFRDKYQSGIARNMFEKARMIDSSVNGLLVRKIVKKVIREVHTQYWKFVLSLRWFPSKELLEEKMSWSNPI